MDFQEFKKKYEHKPVEECPNQVGRNPMVSVCVQTHQHAPYIKECLDGILMQKTDFPFEILVGEDGSTDGTREICIEYAKNHPDKIRLFLHHRENNIKIKGSSTGRFNLLYNIYSAKGKYIAFCEGDDYWTAPFKLTKQFRFLESRNEYSFCFHTAYMVDKNMQKLNSPLNDDSIFFHTKKELKINATTTMSLFLKKECLNQINSTFIEQIPWGDVYMKSVLAKNGPFARLNFIGGYKRMVDGVTMRINMYENYKKSYESLRITAEIIDDPIIKNILNRRMRKIYWNKLYRTLKARDYKMFFKILKSEFNFS